MVREVITVAALTAAFSFLGGCTPRAATLPGFRSETKEFSQSGETFGNPLMGYAPDARRENVSEDITLLYVDITWKELEPECGVYDWDTIEKENQFFRWRSEGKHLVSVMILEMRVIQIFQTGCTGKQGKTETGTTMIMEKDLRRIILIRP